jgi:hypothetical protein
MRVTQNTRCTTNPAKLNHPWASDGNGSVSVSNRTGSTFGIIFTKVPRKACIGLATKLTGGDITNLRGVLINSASQTPPITVVTGAAACNAGDNNTIEWDFDIRA